MTERQASHPVRRGDIWWASVPPAVGSGPGYRRPVLVVQADEFNLSRIGTVIGLVMTSNLRLGGPPGNVELSPRETGLPKPSIANVSQIITVNRRFLTERVSRLGVRKLREVESGLRLALEL